MNEQLDADIDARLRRQARLTPEMSESTCRQLVNRAEVEARARQKRIRIGLIGSLAAVIALGVPSAAVANVVFQAQTGRFNASEEQRASSPVDETENDSDLGVFDPGSEGAPGAEWIDMGASDLDQYIASRAPRDIPLPDGVTWDDALANFFSRFDQDAYIASNDLGGSGQVAAESLVVDIMLENQARREWLTAWFEAYDREDEAMMSEAGLVLGQSADWPAEAASTRGAYLEQMHEWGRLIAAGDYEAAQAYAIYHEWSDFSDGKDYSDVSGEILSGARVAAPEAGDE
ncbi:hypothetical protein [Leucobacter sp. L43]|uniref:hypothetical protein n=1 Tax=Leucobacter sp. L43 TaxID=2798040 RepID=UPI001906A325|nr:hypothetical protein [Leucobacter sp. L43]